MRSGRAGPAPPCRAPPPRVWHGPASAGAANEHRGQPNYMIAGVRLVYVMLAGPRLRVMPARQDTNLRARLLNCKQRQSVQKASGRRRRRLLAADFSIRLHAAGAGQQRHPAGRRCRPVRDQDRRRAQPRIDDGIEPPVETGRARICLNPASHIRAWRSGQTNAMASARPTLLGFALAALRTAR